MSMDILVQNNSIENNGPKEGDFCLCTNCGEIGRIDEHRNCVPCTEDDMDYLLDQNPEIYMQINAASYQMTQLFQLKNRYMKKVFIDIHRAIHNPKQKKIVINGTPTEIQTDPKGLRFVVFKDDEKQFEIIEQNPRTASTYAKRAQEGEKISWLIPHYFGVRKADGWKVITDSTSIEQGG